MENEIKKESKKIEKESSSKMAEGMAMQRFAESSKDKKERICDLIHMLFILLALT